MLSPAFHFQRDLENGKKIKPAPKKLSVGPMGFLERGKNNPATPSEALILHLGSSR